MKKTYRARPGARFPDADAQKIGKELERLRKADGPLTSAAIVEAARARASPLHEYFDWEDSTAADAWRKKQASDLVNRIEVIIERDGQETVVPFMVSVYYKPAPDEPEQRGFITTEEAMSTATYREQIIDDVMGQIKILARKAAAFKELAEILSETAGRIQKLFPATGR